MNNLPCNKAQEQQPSLSIDLKKNRIRIHRRTLHLLGNPNYIQILVNPTKQSLVLLPSVSEDHLAHKINWLYLDDPSNSYELYSKALIKTINTLQAWEPEQIYRIEGTCIATDNSGVAILFYLKESALIES